MEEKVVRLGIGVMILDGDKILLGHRAKKRADTGGIFEPDSWTFPGGKQEFGETFYEGAKREVKEETNLDISDLELFGAEDDVQPNKHYVTLHIIARSHSGELKTMEPEKEDEWRWFQLNDLPDNVYTPSKKFIDNYLKKEGI
ncbi:MAG: NUDIX domain-containing protein [Clostridia bacterium]|nr:NUDIX domain-containing protein [Clostridia bacterium]